MANEIQSPATISVAASSETATQSHIGHSQFRAIQEWSNKPWFAYLTLSLLQLKVIWGVWKYRDLTSGDTASYFTMSYLWYQHFADVIIWSPLYTMFYGTLLYLSTNAYIVTILHRIIIVMVVAVLVLALMRRLLPPSIAWFIAAWWVILPINFDALYEVHLFAVIFPLIIWLLLVSKPSRWRRGCGLAILVTACILMRNELIVAVALLSAIFLWWEIRAAKYAKEVVASKLDYLLSYGAPLLLACLLIIFFYTRSTVQFPDLFEASAPKHTVNMCQVYAYGYKQRHPEWDNSPWTGCSTLMASVFGKPFPSLGEMIKSNPSATLKHFLWNVSLTPNGMQVLLFNATSGNVSPDYAPVQLHSSLALLLTVLLGVIVGSGLLLLYRERSYWWEYWIRSRAWGWVSMFAVASIGIVIIPTQRPRPSYLFSLSILIMAVTGMSLFVILHRYSALRKLKAFIPVVMIMLIVLTPMYYAQSEQSQPRSLLTLYQRLAPFEELIAKSGAVLVVDQYAQDIYGYIVHNATIDTTKVIDYSIFSQVKNASFSDALARNHVNLLYINEKLWLKMQASTTERAFISSPNQLGWDIVALQKNTQGTWMLLQKHDSANSIALENGQNASQNDANQNDVIEQLPGGSPETTLGASRPDILSLGQGWYPIEQFGGETFRWVNNDAEIIIPLPSGVHQQIYIELEPGPGTHILPMMLQVLDQDGKIVSTATIMKRTKLVLDIPVVRDRLSIFRLHSAGGGRVIANDPRILNFRVFKLGWQ